MTSQDVYLVIGVIIVAFSIPSAIGAFTESRAPRASAILILIGGSMILIAMSQSPTGYRLEDIPEAFVRVVAHFLR